MYLSNRQWRAVCGLALTAWSLHANANPLVVGLGAEGDNADSRSYSAFADLGLTDDTWLSGAVATTQTDRDLLDVDTKFAELGIDHHFKPVGVRLSAGYWGDKDLLESTDLRGALYVRGERGSVSLDYQRRNFDLTIGAQLLDRPRSVSFEADGIGVSASAPIGERVRIYAGGMDYDYSRNIRLQPNVDTLRFFSLSRLSIVNSLIDYRANVGLEVSFGDRAVDVRFARWQTEVDQGEINSFGVGFLTPIGAAADLEIRAAFDDSENFGSATVLSFFLYLYSE